MKAGPVTWIFATVYNILMSVCQNSLNSFTRARDSQASDEDKYQRDEKWFVPIVKCIGTENEENCLELCQPYFETDTSRTYSLQAQGQTRSKLGGRSVTHDTYKEAVR